MKLWVVPILHPAYILRGQAKEEPAQIRYLERVKEISEHGWTTFDHTNPPQGAILEPDLGDLFRWSTWIGRAGVTVDIETANRKLRGIGFCRLDDCVPIWVPLCKQGGGPYWSGADLHTAQGALGDILRNPNIPKWFHNGLGFDIPILRYNGYRVNGYAGDTMLMHHIMYPEMRKGLKYLANLYLGIGGWKSLVTDDDEGEAK